MKQEYPERREYLFYNLCQVSVAQRMKECMDIRVSKQKDIRLCISLDMSKLAAIQCSCRPYSQCLQQCPCIIDLRHPHELCRTQLILNRIISGCADTKAAKALLVFWNRLAYGYITGMHAGFASSISKQGCSRRAAAPPPCRQVSASRFAYTPYPPPAVCADRRVWRLYSAAPLPL